ncbi:MAG: hypothetical protein WBX15_12355 [Thermoanaerobaculia bacterium]
MPDRVVEQHVIDELTRIAVSDAERFRREHPGQEPDEDYIDNAYTAGLPVAAQRAGAAEVGRDPHPHLYNGYRRSFLEMMR